MRNKSRLVAVVSAIALMVSLGSASATAATSSSAQDGCSTADYDAGECLGTVYTAGMTEPMVEGVREALQRGDVEQAQAFVTQRGASHSDAVQSEIEGLLSLNASEGPAALVTELPESQVLDANGNADDHQDTDVFIDDPGVVYEGVKYEVNTDQAYTYCTQETCDPPKNSLHIEFNHVTAEYPSIALDGFISVKGSDQVLITDSRCRTQYENFPVDIVVHEWANCAAIKSPGLGLVGVRNIFTENWDQGGTNKKYYHNDYKIAFKPNFGTGNELSIEWTAMHYQVTPGPRALFR